MPYPGPKILRFGDIHRQSVLAVFKSVAKCKGIHGGLAFNIAGHENQQIAHVWNLSALTLTQVVDIAGAQVQPMVVSGRYLSMLCAPQFRMHSV